MTLQYFGRSPAVSWEKLKKHGSTSSFNHDLFLLKKKTPSVEKAISEQRGPNKEVGLDSLAKSVAIYILSIRQKLQWQQKEYQPFWSFLL